MFHPWYHHRDIGQKWMHDPLWDTPFERPGVVPRLYNRQYQLHLYPNNIGAIADVDAPVTKEKPPSGDYAGSGMHSNNNNFYLFVHMYFFFCRSLTHMATSLHTLVSSHTCLFSIILAQRVLVVQRPSNQEQTTNQRTQDKEVAHQKQQQIINHQVYNICHGMV